VHSDRAAEATPPLRAIRLARGRKLRPTARAAKIPAPHLSRVERGQAQLSLPALLRLANELGLTELAAMIAPYVLETNSDD